MNYLDFTGDNAITLMETVMNGYPGRGNGYFYLDQRPLDIVHFLLRDGIIKVSRHSYVFDNSLRGDTLYMQSPSDPVNTAVNAIYHQLARESRWRTYANTEIERVRLNAIKLMMDKGEPYFDTYICYQRGSIQVQCGNITPHDLLIHLARNDTLTELYIFGYPYAETDGTTTYHCMHFNQRAHELAKEYENLVYDEMVRISRKADEGLFPTLDTEKEM